MGITLIRVPVDELNTFVLNAFLKMGVSQEHSQARQELSSRAQ